MLKNAILDAKNCENFAKIWRNFDEILTKFRSGILLDARPPRSGAPAEPRAPGPAARAHPPLPLSDWRHVESHRPGRRGSQLKTLASSSTILVFFRNFLRILQGSRNFRRFSHQVSCQLIGI